MSQPFDVKIFEKHGLSADPSGQLLCPKSSCGLKFIPKFIPGDHRNRLTKETQELIWSHVQTAHVDVFIDLEKKYKLEFKDIPRDTMVKRAIELAVASHGKVIELLVGLSPDEKNEQQILAAILEEFKSAHKRLTEVLIPGSSSST